MRSPAGEIGQEPLTDRRVLRGPFPQAEQVFRTHFIDASGDNDTVSTHVHAINQQPHQVQRVERRRPPRIQLRLGLRDKASTDRTLARAPHGDVGAERFQTPRILAGRHTDQHLVDHAPVQRVRIRECPGRWQRNLLAGAPRSPVVSESNTNTSVRSSKSGQSLYDTVPSSPAAFVIVIGTTSVDTETVAHASFSRRAP